MDFAAGGLQMGQSSEWFSMLFVLGIKSVIVLTTAGLLTHKLRAASAKLRHILWCAALCSLLALPLFSGGLAPFRVPVLPSGIFPSESAAQKVSEEAAVKLPVQALGTFPSDVSSETLHGPGSTVPELSSFSWQSIILLVWLTGVLLVLVRFLVGIVTVRRLVARASELTSPTWSELASELSQELGLKRKVKLLRSDKSVMPMTLAGWSAVVLLPDEAELWSDDRRRVVVLHELIHIKRADLLTQTLAQVVCALYWFNPLVWYAVRKLRMEQEWACDERVVATGVAAPDYAAHLLQIARKFQADAMLSTATTAIASPSQLQKRLCAILRPSDQRYPSARVTAVSAAVLGAVFISTAATQLVTAHRKDRTDVANVTSDARLMEQKEWDPVVLNRKAIVTNPAPVPAAERGDVLEQDPSPTPINQPAVLPSDSRADPPAPSQEAASSDTQDKPLSAFSAEEQARLLGNGIGPAYIKEMEVAGYRGLNVGQLIQLFSNNVRADYVAGLRSVGYTGLSTSDLLSLKTNGITPDVIRSFQAVTRANFKATNYPALRSNGVTPAYVRSLGDAGYDALTANELIAMRLAGVTSDFLRETRSRGNTNLSPQELIELKRSEKH